jgi:thiol-disulfide isomerase/thioredoxin
MSSADPTCLVAALCAQWCGTCREYEPIFERQSERFAGQARFAWIDVEEHDEVMGAIDVENFPTLLIALGDEVVFFGPVTPHEQTLARLIETGLQGGLKPVGDPALHGLPARVRQAA